MTACKGGGASSGALLKRAGFALSRRPAALRCRDPRFGGKGFAPVDGWIAAKRSAELHVFAKGRHGFGMNATKTSSEHWIDSFYR